MNQTLLHWIINTIRSCSLAQTQEFIALPMLCSTGTIFHLLYLTLILEIGYDLAHRYTVSERMQRNER